MYKNLYFDRKTSTIHLWSDKKHGDKAYEKFTYSPYAYKINPSGTHKTLTGLKVERVTEWSTEAVKQGVIFEHDIPAPMRTLIDRYYESDEPSTDHTILFFDIEIVKGKKYSKPSEAFNVINSIAYYVNGKYTVLILGDFDDCVQTIPNVGQVDVKVFGEENELLHYFVSQWNKIKPTIVTSWNGNNFDVPYLVNRITNVLGYNYTKKLSPIGIVYSREQGKNTYVTIAGVSQMDYLVLYKKFTYNEESSYSLEAISQKELKRGKIKYDGSLDTLYKNDIAKFIEYNVNDVELIVSIDKKMDLIEIARGICHKGHVPYEDFEFSSRYLDGSIATRCKRQGIVTISNLSKTTEYEMDISELFVKKKKVYFPLDIATIKDKTVVYILDGDEYENVGTYFVHKQKKVKKGKIIITSGKAKGAFVKPPNVGKHKWVYSIDLQSLYPSLIITQNNSLETQIGVIENWDELSISNKLSANLKPLENFGYIDDNAVIQVTPIIRELFSDENPNIQSYTKSEFINYVGKYNATISSAGVIFSTLKKGIIPEILSEWFDERVMFKNKMKDYQDGSPEYVYFDRKQLITKILLNSLYGVLLLPSFRYYSKLSGESVTLSGQTVIKFSDFIINLFYKNKLKDKYKTNCVVYGDSDSLYIDAQPLIEDFDNLTDAERIVKTKQISDEVTQFVNKAIKWLATYGFHSTNNRLKFNQEKVSKRAFWGQAKKRYAQLSVELNDDGSIKEKIDIKGFDVVRSSFPKTFRAMMKDVIIDILHDIEVDDLNSKVRHFKTDFKRSSIFDIMLPSSVKEISKFQIGEKGTPIHVKSAQNYNQLLKIFNIDYLPPIDDGDKIVYAYMSQNPYGFETMALKGQDEDPPEIIDFVSQYIDKNKVFEKSLISKLDTIWHDLGWGKVELREPNNFF